MARLRLFLLGIWGLVAGCTQRAVALAGDAGQGDVPSFDSAHYDKAVEPSCRLESAPLERYVDPGGAFSLAVAGWAEAAPVRISGALAGEAAVALSHASLAGLAATRPAPAGAEPALELTSLYKALLARLPEGAALHVRTSGALGRSHDGHPHLMGAIWDLFTGGAPLGVDSARNLALAAVLQRPLAALSGLPRSSEAASRSLVLRLSLVQRGAQLAYSAAVLRREDHDNPSSMLPIMADDLANGSGLATARATMKPICDVGTVTGQPRADIIWVVDESLSMDDNRKSIVENAELFFKKALAANLDFRMGVTGVRRPDGYSQMGKFCSRDGPQADDGGDDRFLLASERDVFTACVKNPPYFEQSFEYGLSNAFGAVTRHLPRAESPGRIRPGARLTLIIVTDEAPQELKPDGAFLGKPGFLEPADWNRCRLAEPKPTRIAELLHPISQLLSGATDPEAAATVHLLGGICHSSCGQVAPEVAHGYRELVELLGGQIGDICQGNLGPTLQVMVDSIAASASPRTLQHVPVSASLEVELNGVRLPRSQQQGYLYDAHSNALTFVNVKVHKGDLVLASYRSFAPPP